MSAPYLAFRIWTVLFGLLCLCSCAAPKSSASRSQVVAPSSETDLGESAVRSKEAGTSQNEESPCDLPDAIRDPTWPRSLSPTSPEEPRSENERAFSIAVLPDTQYYANCQNEHLENQTRWLASQRKARDLAFTVHLGDLTEHNSDEQWQYVAQGLKPVSEAMPLFLATGNHDYGDQGSANQRSTSFQRYFSDPGRPTRRVTAALASPGDWENAYYRLPIADIHLGVLVLEWSPRKKTVDWARKTLKAYPEDRILFVTHAYLYYDGTRYDWDRFGAKQEWNPRTYGTAKKDPEKPPGQDNWASEGAYDGEMLWQDLLRHHGGVFLTLNGHVLGDGAAVASDRAAKGNLVHQVLVNYQMLDEGGLGYLRLIEVAADGSNMVMKTYSPSLGLFATGEEQTFTLPIEPPLF